MYSVESACPPEILDLNVNQFVTLQRYDYSALVNNVIYN